MWRVVWSDRALADLVAIRRYIEQFNPRAAQLTAARLVAAADALAHFPERGRPHQNSREIAVVYPYLIRYEIAATEVTILRIRHGSQLPA
jgi:toxin ParE1/3/4